VTRGKIPTIPIDRERLLSLWNLEDIPACGQGMELARTFLERAGAAVDTLGTDDPVSSRFAFASACKELVRHRASCEKCRFL
jgi:hypothetical protein